MTYTHWRVDADDRNVHWLCLDYADGSANVLSTAVFGELSTILDGLEAKPPKGVVFWSGKRGAFVMGADINEFENLTTPERAFELTRLGQQLIDRIEALPCPTVAAINGHCLGGGLELAMACRYRVGLENDRKILGLPEIKLGLHPGFGGTVRSIRLCGVRPGMQLMLTGNSITIDKGRRIGLVDAVATESDWREACHDLIQSAPSVRRAPLVERILGWAPLRPLVRSMLIKQVRGKARREHYPAPYALIDLWATHGASPATGYEAEARSFAELVCTSTSRNLVRVFFLQNRLKSQGSREAPKVGHVHVVGAGVMGGDIAAWCALRGHSVTLQDREQRYIDPAIERAQKLFAKRIRDDDERAAARGRLVADLAGDGVAKADLIIEAIFENLEAKQALYTSLQSEMKPEALIATNTSSIRLEDLRGVLTDPRRFIGLHFFNPVALMPLVEVIRCADTDRDALDVGFGFVRGIGKLPLECASAPGFVVNRILAPYMGEAMQLVEDGVPLAAIDAAAEGFGMPMGPVELVDSVGLDVALHVARVLGSSMDTSKLQTMVDDGRKGRKSGEGFYRWEDGKPQKPPAGDAGVPEDIEDRLILPMVNEAVACLADGIVADEELLDAGVIFGTGFAPFRGGPLKYARDRGLERVVGRLEELAGRHGPRFAPHPGFSNLK